MSEAKTLKEPTCTVLSWMEPDGIPNSDVWRNRDLRKCTVSCQSLSVRLNLSIKTEKLIRAYMNALCIKQKIEEEPMSSLLN